jgi:predicted alpha/beta-hydrolase family hydrolase
VTGAGDAWRQRDRGENASEWGVHRRLRVRRSATTQDIIIDGGPAGEVGGLLMHPPGAACLLVFAHGAGAGMRHAFMDAAAAALAHRCVATLRFEFPYMHKGSRRPDPPAVLHATVRAAVQKAAATAPGLPLFAGGKSMGGRMTSLAAADQPLPDVRGLVFFGFPLHAAGSPSSARGAHLARVTVPMLFLQGTRDKLADLDLLRPLLHGVPRATLEIVEGADHSFHVPKSSGRTDAGTLADIAAKIAGWTEPLRR